MKVFYNLVKKDGLLADPKYKPEYLVFHSDQPRRHFYFKTYREFEEYYLNLVEEKSRENKFPHWFEVIKGDRPQKPHFDIDILDDTEPRLVLEELFVSVESVLSRMGHEFHEDDFYVYTSHSDEVSKHAASYHVILPGFHHKNNLEARAFYEEVVLYMFYRRFIDTAVYKSHQNFRLLWSSKGGSTRQKIPLGSDDLHASMVSQLEKGSVHLKLHTTIAQELLPSIEDEELSYILQLIPRDHTFRGVSGPFIVLNRTSAGICQLCCRVHDGENGFIFVKDGLVYYNCRRTDSGGFVLGLLPSPEAGEDEPSSSFSSVNEEEEESPTPPIIPVKRPKKKSLPVNQLRRMASREVDDFMWNVYSNI